MLSKYSHRGGDCDFTWRFGKQNASKVLIFHIVFNVCCKTLEVNDKAYLKPIITGKSKGLLDVNKYKSLAREYCLIVWNRVSQPGLPAPTLGATERFSGGREQRLLLNSSAVILQNPCVTILLIRQLKGGGGHKPWKFENHWFRMSVLYQQCFSNTKERGHQKNGYCPFVTNRNNEVEPMNGYLFSSFHRCEVDARNHC